MAYKEYKVLHVTEGGLGTIIFGASGIPIKQLEVTLNKEAAESYCQIWCLNIKSSGDLIV